MGEFDNYLRNQIAVVIRNNIKSILKVILRLY